MQGRSLLRQPTPHRTAQVMNAHIRNSGFFTNACPGLAEIDQMTTWVGTANDVRIVADPWNQAQSRHFPPRQGLIARLRIVMPQPMHVAQPRRLALPVIGALLL